MALLSIKTQNYVLLFWASQVPPNMDQMMAEMMQQMNSFLNKTVMKEPIGAVTAKV
jgi:hypothetical protein